MKKIRQFIYYNKMSKPLISLQCCIILMNIIFVKMHELNMN